MLKCSKCGQEKDESQFFKNERYTSGYMTWCKACHREYYRQPEQKEKAKPLVRKWYQRHLQDVKEYNKQWHQDNKERRHETNNARGRERWANDPEYRERKNKQKVESVQRRLETDQSFIKKVKAWTATAAKRRRARLANVETTLDTQEWESLCAKYDNRCLCCGEQKPLTVDHIVPLSKGGSHTIDNVQPLCRNCNSKKHKKTIDYRTRWET